MKPDRYTTCPDCGTPGRLGVYKTGRKRCATCGYTEDAARQTGLNDY